MSKRAKDHHRKGLDHASKNNYAKAIVAYTRAIELDPDEAEFYSDRAVAFFHTDQAQHSLTDMNKARELEPNKGYRYSSRAFIKDHLGDLDGAIEDYKMAVHIDPEDAIAQNNLGLLEEKKGYVQSSKKRFVTADQLAEGDKEKIKRGETPDRWKQNGNGASANGRDDGARAPSQKPEPLRQEPLKRPGWKDIFREMGQVFSSGKEFKKFLTFVRKGWRKKEE